MNESVSKNSVLFVSTVSAFTTPFMVSSVHIALPSIGRTFKMDAILLSWVLTSYLLASAVSLVPFGRIADIYGRRKFYFIGTFLFSFSCLGVAFSLSPLMLIGFRVLQGIGNAIAYATGVAMLTSVFPAEERGKVLGINAAVTYLGLSLGPVIGGFLTHHFGWRSIFISIFPFGLTALIFTLWKLKGEWVEAKGEKIDIIGSVIYGSILIVLIYGLSILPNLWGVGLMVISFLGILVFNRWELKTESPLLDISLIKNNRAFAFSNLAALIHYSATYAIAFFISLYLQYIKALPPQVAGMILIAQPFVQAILSPFAGRLSDRVEPRIVATTGMSFTAIGLFLLSFLNERTAFPYIVGSLMLLGFGYAFFASPNTNAVLSSVEKKYYGVASATVGTMRVTGQMFSMGIVTVIFSVVIGRMQITPENYLLFLKSLKIGFTIFAILCLGGVYASYKRVKT